MKVRLKHQVLAQLLARRSITQNRWAQMLGISRGHLSDLVNGRHVHPAPRTRRKLLEGLGVEFETLFEVEVPERKPARMVPSNLSGIGQPDLKPLPRTTKGKRKMTLFLDDLRNALRQLRRAPAFTAAVLLTLGLGIGGNTAIFSVVNAVLLEPLPFPQSSRLVFLPRDGDSQADVSIPDGIDIREQASALSQVALFMPFSGFDLVGKGEPERLRGSVVEPEFFEVMGVQPVIGRLLDAKDNLPGAAGAAVISEGLWKRRFGGDTGLLGQSVTLSGQPVTIVGVAPSHLDFLEIGTELWVTVAAGAP